MAGKFDAMQRYKDQYGDCLLPWEWSVDKGLSDWVHTQRALNSSGTLRVDRKRQLEQLGFSWVGRRFVGKQAKTAVALDGKESDDNQANDRIDDSSDVCEGENERNSGYFNSVFLSETAFLDASVRKK